jgi:hypothetical protein
MKSGDGPEPTGGRAPGRPAAGARADEQLLIELLSRPPSRGGRGRSAWRRRLRAALLIALAAAGLVGVFAVGRIAVALITIRQNIQAMRLPTPAPRPTQLALVPQAARGSTAAATASQPAAAQATPTSPASPPATSAPVPQATSTPAEAPGELTVAITPSPPLKPLPTLTPIPRQLPAVDGLAAPPGSRAGNLAPALAAPAAGQLAPASAAPAAGQPVTVLLLGVDRRPGETDP